MDFFSLQYYVGSAYNPEIWWFLQMIYELEGNRFTVTKYTPSVRIFVYIVQNKN